MSGWLLLSGEFPPDPGGVADYTRAVAEGLAARGHEVHVAAPRSRRGSGVAGGASVHLLPDCFGPRGLARLSAVVREVRPERLFVQYVPHAFGYKALNFGFCAWLAAQRIPIWTQFHEVAFPLGAPVWRRTNLLAVGHRAMAGVVCQASDRHFVTTRRWERLLAPWVSGPPVWLPVPSNVATGVDREGAARWRERLGIGAGVGLVGHFGNYGRLLGPVVREVLPRLLSWSPRAHALLLGRSGPEFRARLCADQAWLARRVHAPGALAAEEVSAAIQACDLMVQPYEDGVTSRRGSLMAALGVGASVLTTRTRDTEAWWSERGAVALAPFAADPIAAQAAALLADPKARERLAVGARELYEEHFALERTLERLEAAL